MALYQRQVRLDAIVGGPVFIIDGVEPMARRRRIDGHLAWLASALLELEDEVTAVALRRELSEQESRYEVMPLRGGIRNVPSVRMSGHLSIQRAFEESGSQFLQLHSRDDRRSPGCSERTIVPMP